MPAQTIQELEAQFDEAIAKLPGLVLKVTEQSALGALALALALVVFQVFRPV